MGGAESGAWRRNSYMSQMLVLLALATPTVAYYDGPRGYCSPFTARYLTLIDDVLVFHGGQGYILRPKRGCLAEMSLPKHEDRHTVSYIKPFREESWLNDTLNSPRSLGLPPAMVNNYAVAKTPWGCAGATHVSVACTGQKLQWQHFEQRLRSGSAPPSVAQRW